MSRFQCFTPSLSLKNMVVLKLNRIKSLLTDRRRRNSELAEFLGMSVNMISLWNSNKSQPPLKECYRIAEFLKLKDWREIFEPEPFEITVGKDIKKSEP